MAFVLAVLIFTFLLLSLIAKKNVKDLNTIASVSVGFLPLVCTVIAVPIGGGSIISIIENGFKYGISPLIGFLGFSLQLFIISLIFTSKRINILSVGDLFSQTYGTPAKVFTGFFVVIFNLGMIITMIRSISFALEPCVDLLIAPTICCATVFIICCYIGGITSIIWTNIIQCIFMLISPVIGVALIYSYYDNFSQFINCIPKTHWKLYPEYSYVKSITIFTSFLLGNALMPPILHSLNMSKNVYHASYSHIIAGIFIAFFAFFLIACGMGFAATNINHTGNILSSIIIAAPFPLKIFIMSFVLTAILSSMNSFLHIAAITFVNDILKPFFRNINQLKAVKISVLILGAISIILVFFISLPLIDMLFFAYKFWGPLFLAPLVGIYFNKLISKAYLYINSFITICIMLLWNLFAFDQLTEINDLIIGVGANFVLYIITRMLKNRSISS